MLRSGASNVVGVELDNKFVAQANFVKEAFEWADNVLYDYKPIAANMLDIPTMQLGSFDITVALNCLYYLPEDEIPTVIRYISEISSIIILQCNETIGINRSDPDTYRKASLDFNVSILRNNGFQKIKIIKIAGYNYPLVIGYIE